MSSEGADLAAQGRSAAARLAEPSLAGVEDYVALLKPRVMSLVVFTALVGLLVAPGHVHPVIGFTALLCIAIGAGASGALNMWYDADIDAVMTRTARRPIPAGRVRPDEALAFGVDARGRLGAGARRAGQLVRGGAARLHDRLLRLRLHDVAEALDAAEHRDRRRGRRVSADDRLGGGDRRHRPRAGADVPHHLPVDAAALLGAVAAARRRLCARRRADAAGGRRAGRDAQADPALFARARAGRRCADAVRVCRPGLWRGRARSAAR